MTSLSFFSGTPMVRGEPRGPVGRAGMGQGNSKADGIDTASPADRMAPNGHVNGAGDGLQQSPASPRFDLSGIRSPDTQFSGRNTLKRTRDKLEKNDYEHDGDYRLHLSRNNAKHSRLDRRSPPRERHSVSPANTRNAFVPDRYDHWNPNMTHQHRRENSGSSSNAPPRQGRGDRYVPRQASPTRRLSPPTRPRLGPRASSGFTIHSNSVPDHSTRERRESEPYEKQRYTNLKWTAPGLNPRQTTNGFEQRISTPVVLESPLSPVESTEDYAQEHAARLKVNVNGVQGVPTGPKSDPRTKLPSLNVRKKRPFIFVSGRSLRPQPSTLPHLAKYLEPEYHVQPSDVEMDEKGYYVYFDRTPRGLALLDKCHKEKNGKKLFSQYVMNMSCHLDGLRDGIVNANPNQQGTARPSNQVNDNPRQPRATFDILEPSLPTPPLQQSHATADPHLELSRAASLPSSRMESPVTATAVPLRHSSPLRVPSSHDKDDSASSVSGITGSDLSASRASKCHVCRYSSFSDSDVLAQCSSCVRRYHYRCHKDPPIPEGLGSEHSWQCRRCIKKNVQPKSRLSNASFARSPSLVPSVGQSEEPPAKKRRIDNPSPEPVPIAFANEVVASGTGIDGVQRNVNGTTDEFLEGDMARSLSDVHHQDESTAFNAPANSDELHFQEANDIVEKGFAPADNAPEEKEKKRLIIKVTRKKNSRDGADKLVDHNGGQHDDNIAANNGDKDLPSASGQDANLNSNDASPKRERHKWKGGGADRAIIEAGMQNFFSDKSANGDRQESAQGRNRDDQFTSIGSGPQLEVPESPEESRQSKNSSKPDRGDIDAPRKHQSPKFKLTLHNTKPDERMNKSKPQSGPAQRMKSSGASADKCRKCKKTIAFNPSGNTYCSKCRKAASMESTTTSAVLGEDRTDEHDVLPSGPGAAEKVAADILDFLRPAEAAPDGYTESAPPGATEGAHESQSAKSTASCAKCRTRHKRCIHRSDSDIIEEGDEGLSKDDLDFWNAPKVNGDTGQSLNGEHTTTSWAPNLDEPGRERSSSLSPAPDEAPASATKIKKRTSYARAATSEYDVGDSFARPPNSYKKLIGMALCAAENQILTSNAIVRWIDENIPGYTVGEGRNWENGISATLSMKQDKEGNLGLWKKIGGGDGSKKNQPCWYQLLPGKEFEMLHWDPVLKQAVSPMKRLNDGARSTKDTLVNGDGQHPISEQGETPTQSPKARLKLTSNKPPKVPRKHAPKSGGDAVRSPVRKQKAAENSEEEADELQASTSFGSKGAESSDEEPISATRRKGLASARRDAPSAAQHVDESGNAKDVESMNGMSGMSEGNEPKTLTKLSILRQLPLRVDTVDKDMVARLIKRDAETVDYSAASLFDEWPEYDPANKQFDRVSKLAEIQQRPTRKQRFGKSALHADPWSQWEPARFRYNDSNVSSPQRSSRASRTVLGGAFEWETSENIEYFDTIGEMFDQPKFQLAFIQDRQIAYRDGTRNDDGTLPRPKKIYNIGYARN